MKKSMFTSLTGLAILFTLALLGPNNLLAHCDGMDGPVIAAAKQALETGEINLVLIWVSKKDETEIRNAFQKTLSVRKLNPEAKAARSVIRLLSMMTGERKQRAEHLWSRLLNLQFMSR